jgi:hypothetical protein
MPDLIPASRILTHENELDSAKASLRARVKPGMTKTVMMTVCQASAQLSI